MWSRRLVLRGIVDRNAHVMNHDKMMKANTSLIMFPIYGMAACLSPICKFVKEKNFMVRGGIYTFFIYLAEFVSGTFLMKKGICPWDYSKSRYHVNGVFDWTMRRYGLQQDYYMRKY